INTIVENYLKTVGKQIRPIIVMLSAKMFAEVTPRVISGAAAVELLHNSSLIHDDVVDESKLRRGQPTINSIWDNHIAVLVGDYFVSVALQQAISTNDLRIIATISELGKMLSQGELDQIYNARYHTITEQAYFDIIDRKTASLFVACARIGCYSVDADEESTEKLVRFTKLLGECFQIKDDIFDYLASDSQIGKPVGNDLREGKITLPLLYALEHSQLPEREAMVELSRTEALSEEDIQRLIEFTIASGGIDYATAVMHRLRAEGSAIMETLPQSDVTRAFMSVFDYIISRDK
ncbi:MAG: polyprenyl synthetase family protein, partial [Muribaculaceae bacterium]|nr:polyprenyl synthetase family protein [Muribaculaceae bacterium]